MKVSTKTALVGAGTFFLSLFLIPYSIQLAGERIAFRAGQKAAWPIAILTVAVSVLAHREFKKRERLKSLRISVSDKNPNQKEDKPKPLQGMLAKAPTASTEPESRRS